MANRQIRVQAEKYQCRGLVADTYPRDGFRDGRFKILEVVPIGGRSVLVTVDWEVLRGDGTVIRGWRQSYSLVRVKGEWLILVSTFHVN